MHKLCVKLVIIDIWELRKSKLYGSGTGPLQHQSRPGRDTACQGKLGGEKSYIVVYGSARSSECEAHGPSTTATFEYLLLLLLENHNTLSLSNYNYKDLEKVLYIYTRN